MSFVRARLVPLLLGVTLASGCREKGPPAWASECPEFDQHWVACCNGGQGAVEGRFGTEDAHFVVDGGRGFALQAGCTAPSFQIEGRVRETSAPAPFNLSLRFRLDAGGTPSGLSVSYFRADDRQGQLFQNNTLVNGQLVPTDAAVQIDERRPWHVRGRLTGTLIRDPHRDAIPIQMNATFGFDTVYFEWREED
jgi:hypothetical protein